tara:strand:+ start:554 stop:1315 length:762 start_codon:yes stop_codon:yes gene_type:complete
VRIQFEEKEHKLARSPSYPQFTLPKCLDLLKMLYESAHRATVDSQTAIEALGYSPRSGSGLAALSSLKQFDLIEGRDEKISITVLGLTLLEPMDDDEFVTAYKKAALSPSLFNELHEMFEESAPSESVLRSMAIRKYEFTATGAEKLYRSFSDTMARIQSEKGAAPASAKGNERAKDSTAVASDAHGSKGADMQHDGLSSDREGSDEPGSVTKLQFPISANCTAVVSFHGPVTAGAINKLIAHLQLSADIYSD